MKWYKKLLYWGFCGNFWGWFHALSGGILAKIGLLFLSAMGALIGVLVAAIVWEFWEFYWECKGDWGIVEKTYGSVEKYWYDTVGDILLAVIFAAVVVL